MTVSTCGSCWCHVLVAKGRTNLELREQFFLAEGVSQTMSGFKSKVLARQSSPGSAAAAGSQVDSATTGSSAHSSSAASALPVKVCVFYNNKIMT